MRHLIVLPLLSVIKGFPERITNQNIEMVTLYGGMQEEVAEMAAYAGFVMEEILMNEVVGMEKYEEETQLIY